MQERAYGKVKGGVVELRSPLPEGAPVDVIVLGAPLDVIHRLRTRQTIDWQETVVNRDGGPRYVERMDPEVPAILRANGAEEAFNRRRDVLRQRLPNLLALAAEASEDREVSGLLWVVLDAVLPAGLALDRYLELERAVNLALQDENRNWPCLVLGHRVRSEGE